MGNDGGDIPKRKQLVRQKKKVEIATAQSIAVGRSRYCNLTKNKLKQPLAICRIGNIYNYQSLLEALVKKQLPQKYYYIKKITDIKKVIIDRALPESQNYIACPISKLQYNGFNKFIAYWQCGHVVSRKAVKQVNSQQKVCVVCQTPYQQGDIIDLNLQNQHLEYLRKKLIQKRKKKQKKHQQQELDKGPQKKIKTQFFVNSVDRLQGEFRDTLRQRQGFRQLFSKQIQPSWKKDTFFVKKDNKESKQ